MDEGEEKGIGQRKSGRTKRMIDEAGAKRPRGGLKQGIETRLGRRRKEGKV